MEAGKDLDTSIAEQVMDWHRGKGGAIVGVPGHESPVHWYDADGKQQAACVLDVFANLHPWSPSTDIAAAFQVIAHLQHRAWDFYRYPDSPVWRVLVWEHDKELLEPPWVIAEADTAPLAICLAALQATGKEAT